VATFPSMPGLSSISTRMVRLYWADGVCGTGGEHIPGGRCA
jgi:hypothetical protein